VAQYGDACNLFATGELEHKLQVLKNHCEDVGRNYDDIEKTVLMGMRVNEAARTTDAVLERITAMRKLGVQHVIFGNEKEVDMKALDIIGEKLVPKIHAL
jgi:alkanesulfonate monooxygenase